MITSILDNDWYSFTMGSVIFHLFPRATVTYKFIDRGGTSFPDGFGLELSKCVNSMSSLALAPEELTWLKTVPYMRPTYAEWLQSYRFDPSEVTIDQLNGNLDVTIHGPWYRTVYWEEPLLATISELYFKMIGQKPASGWDEKIVAKAKNLSSHGCYWIDFGTRRRFSYHTQEAVVSLMKHARGFLGTSNAHFAQKHGLAPQGTYSHQGPMAMMALYGLQMANKMWMTHWAEHFQGSLGITLTDTFTTKHFLRDFDAYHAKLFDGARQDSGIPLHWGHGMLKHYSSLGILARDKRLVFSDKLTDETYIPIHQSFNRLAKPIAGIGTFLTNDVGAIPLEIVIKLMNADFGFGPVNVVKISDNLGKVTGDHQTVARVMAELGIGAT